MDGSRFDDLTRTLAGGLNRRRLLKGMVGGVLGGFAGLAGRGATAACPPGQAAVSGNRCVCKSTGRPPGADGTCPCPSGLTNCGGDCVDTGRSSGHCGGCGQACPVGPNVSAISCVRGACMIVACSPGYADCDGDPSNGCETALGTVEACAACGDVCPTAPPCRQSVCTGGVCDTVADPAQNDLACPGGICCNGSCIPACVASDACHLAGSCDPATGACTNPPAPAGTACGDTASCAAGLARAADVCDGTGACVLGESVSCGLFTCDEAGVACRTSCAADDECIALAHCDDGLCLPDLPIGAPCDEPSDCADGLFCVRDQPGGPGICCNEPCDDACRSCRAQTPGLCQPVLNGTPCDDGNPCTINDACLMGVCSGATITCATTDPCLQPGTCNPATGQCSPPVPVENGTPCDDGDPCTTGDVCTDGVCAGVPRVCTLADLPVIVVDPCVQPVCQPGVGCVAAPVEDGTACEPTIPNDDPCLYNFTCQAGVCTGTPTICESGRPCLESRCDGQGGCLPPTPKPLGSSCDDGNPCTADDFCGISFGGSDPGCFGGRWLCGPDCGEHLTLSYNGTVFEAWKPLPDGNACDGYQHGPCLTPNSGTCRGGYCFGAPLPDGQLCDDVDICEVNGICVDGACVGTVTAPNGTRCEVNDPCVISACFQGVCSELGPVEGGSCTSHADCCPGTYCVRTSNFDPDRRECRSCASTLGDNCVGTGFGDDDFCCPMQSCACDSTSGCLSSNYRCG